MTTKTPCTAHSLTLTTTVSAGADSSPFGTVRIGLHPAPVGSDAGPVSVYPVPGRPGAATVIPVTDLSGPDLLRALAAAIAQVASANND